MPRTVSHHHARWAAGPIRREQHFRAAVSLPFSLFTPCQLSNRWTALTYFRVVVVAQSTLNHLRDSCHKGSIKGNYILWRTVSFHPWWIGWHWYSPNRNSSFWCIYTICRTFLFIYTHTSLEWTRFPLGNWEGKEIYKNKSVENVSISVIHARLKIFF